MPKRQRPQKDKWTIANTTWEVRKAVWHQWSLGHSADITLDYLASLSPLPKREGSKRKGSGVPEDRTTIYRIRRELLQLPLDLARQLVGEIPALISFVETKRPDLRGQLATTQSYENGQMSPEARQRHFQELLRLIEVLEKQVEHLGNTTPTSVLEESSLSISYPSGLASNGGYKDILCWTADERRIKRLWLAVEEDRRFGFLRQHLQPSSLWTCYEDWKKAWRQGLWFSYELDAMHRGHIPSPKSKHENDRLFAKMKADHKRRSRCDDCLMAELVKVRSRGTLPGTCDCCST